MKFITIDEIEPAAPKNFPPLAHLLASLNPLKSLRGFKPDLNESFAAAAPDFLASAQAFFQPVILTPLPILVLRISDCLV